MTRSQVSDTQQAGWVGRFAGLCAVLVVTFTAFGAVVPVLPFLVLEELDGTTFAVGAVFGVSALVALVGRPYAGRAAQRFGSRRVMLVGCLLAGLVGVLYAAPFGLPSLYGTRVLHGVAESIVFTAGSVWVVALAPESRRGQLVGYYGLAMWTGFTVGPLVGTVLRAQWGYPAVWWFAGLAPLLAAAMLLAVPTPGGSGQFTSRRLVPRTVLLPGTSLALAAFGYAALTGFVVLHLAERGIGNGGAMLSLFGVGYVVVRVLAGRLPDRVGATRVVVVCGAVEAVGLVLLTVAGTWWLAAVGALVMGAGFTLLYPSLALLVIKASPEAERGAALGAYTSFWDLGLGVAGLVTGAVAAAGYPAVFVLAAVSAVAAGVAGGIAGLRAERASG
ncbi:MAG TPA: MFS transporter [Micromonosporaceae bacterium]